MGLLWVGPLDSHGRYVLKIHSNVESGPKTIQFNIHSKFKSEIFIQTNNLIIHSTKYSFNKKNAVSPRASETLSGSPTDLNVESLGSQETSIGPIWHILAQLRASVGANESKFDNSLQH